MIASDTRVPVPIVSVVVPVTPDEDAVRVVFALTERERQVLVSIARG